MTEQPAYPAPEVLAAYEAITPGAADRIFKRIEAEATHRHKLETNALSAQIADAQAQRSAERLGQIFGLVVALFTVGAASYTAVNGAQVAGSIIGTGGLIGLVAVFILGRRIKPVTVPRYDRALAEPSAATLPPS